MKYAVVTFFEGDIRKVGTAETLRDAETIMEDDFMDHVTREGKFRTDVEDENGCELCQDSAWMEIMGGKYEKFWQILEV